MIVRDLLQATSLPTKAWTSPSLIFDRDEYQRRRSPGFSRKRRCLQEIPNDHRLIFVLDVLIAVRAGELLGLRWLNFRPSRKRSQSAAACGEVNSGRRRRRPAYDWFTFGRRLSSY